MERAIDDAICTAEVARIELPRAAAKHPGAPTPGSHWIRYRTRPKIALMPVIAPLPHIPGKIQESKPGCSR